MLPSGVYLSLFESHTQGYILHYLYFCTLPRKDGLRSICRCAPWPSAGAIHTQPRVPWREAGDLFHSVSVALVCTCTKIVQRNIFDPKFISSYGAHATATKQSITVHGLHLLSMITINESKKSLNSLCK